MEHLDCHYNFHIIWMEFTFNMEYCLICDSIIINVIIRKREEEVKKVIMKFKDITFIYS